MECYPEVKYKTPDIDKMKTIFLSYPLTPNTPAYGNGKSLSIEPINRIDAGDSCNTSQLHFQNHLGTHVDCPKHFSQNGKTVTDYSAGFWTFMHPHIIDISPLHPGHLIDPDDLGLSGVSENADLLLIKTGFGKFRGDPVYWENNPGIHMEVATAFRSRLPKLRMIGLDTISISSFAHREAGRAAHRAFLASRRPILLLEDVDLEKVNSNTRLSRIVISPLRVEKADGVPCTVFAEIGT